MSRSRLAPVKSISMLSSVVTRTLSSARSVTRTRTMATATGPLKILTETKHEDHRPRRETATDTSPKTEREHPERTDDRQTAHETKHKPKQDGMKRSLVKRIDRLARRQRYLFGHRTSTAALIRKTVLQRPPMTESRPSGSFAILCLMRER